MTTALRTVFSIVLLTALLATAAAAMPQRILLCIDGVPYSLIDEARKEGHFKSFAPPARLISTFPAITEVMLTEFYQTEPPPGYGLRYYDKAKNELVGGIGDQDAISVWFELYDYITPMSDRGLTYVWGRWSYTDLDYLDYHLEAHDSEIVLIHLDSTDAMMHHEKPYATKRWLVSLSERLDKFFEKHGDAAPEIVIFSDHGNEMTPTRRIPVESWLKKKGFKPGGVISGDSGVAILPTGLISTGYIYTADERAVAIALRGMPGFDLSLYEKDNVVHVISNEGEATIERNSDGSLWRYTVVQNDPLKLEPVISELFDSGFVSEDGWIDDRAFFSATLDHEYPDVLNLAWGGVTGHVKNVGDVMISLKTGWHSGSAVLSNILKFEGTHGSLKRLSVTGFIISSDRELPALRTKEALGHLDWSEIVKRHAADKGVKLQL